MTTQEAIKKLIIEIEEKKDYLTELDRKIGDADHGFNLALGFAQINQKIANLTSSKELLKMTGQTLMNNVGGSSGLLYGMSILTAANKVSDEARITFEQFKNFVSQVTKTVTNLGKASVQQKTMLDVWRPLNDFLKTQNQFSKKMIRQKLLQYRDATIKMQAKKGRASYLGSRSIGAIDPGAASSEIIIRNLLDAIND